MEDILSSHAQAFLVDDMYQDPDNDNNEILDEFLDSRMYNSTGSNNSTSDVHVKIEDSFQHPSPHYFPNKLYTANTTPMVSPNPETTIESSGPLTPNQLINGRDMNQTGHRVMDNFGNTSNNNNSNINNANNNALPGDNFNMASIPDDLNFLIKQEIEMMSMMPQMGVPDQRATPNTNSFNDMMMSDSNQMLLNSVNNMLSPNNNNYNNSISNQNLSQNNQNNNQNINNNNSQNFSNTKAEEFDMFEISKNQLMNLKFGNKDKEIKSQLNNELLDNETSLEKVLDKMGVISSPIKQEYIDILNGKSSYPELPYKLRLSEVPPVSRVETQMKLQLTVSPAPPQYLLKLPADTISKMKLNLDGEIPEEIKSNVLSLEVFVIGSNEEMSDSMNSPISGSNKNSPASVAAEDDDASHVNGHRDSVDDTNDGFKMVKSLNTCKRCIRRELKRASRKKTGPSDDSGSWLTGDPKRAIIFNCKEVVSFPRPTVDNPTEKSIDLLCRVICYCRHHHESRGFKLFFILKNHNEEILGYTVSSPVMVMDRKKSNKHDGSDGGTNKSSVENRDTQNYTAPSERMEMDLGGKPLSPNSMEESSSDINSNALHPNDGRSNKRQKRPLSPSTGNYDSGYSRITSRNSSVSQSGKSSAHTHQPISPATSDPLSSPQNVSNSNGSIFSTTPERLNYHSSTSVNSTGNMVKNALNQISPSNVGLLDENNLNPMSVSTSTSSEPSRNENLPTIQRIIPAQGPIRGGIEVTLLGSNFRPGLTVKFGSNLALATHCWSDSTIVTYLPPATQAGPVLVTFIEYNDNSTNVLTSSSRQIFTYTDDSDRQLIELALQIVGLKMNGKLEDAKNIAKRIIGNNSNNSNGDSGNTSTSNDSTVDQTMTDKDMEKTERSNYDEWLAQASSKLTELTQSNLNHEDVLLKLFAMLQLPNSPIATPNWGLCTAEGQTILHLACLKGYIKLVYYLLNHGSKTDYRDVNDFTPFQLSLINGNRQLIQLLMRLNANTSLNIRNGVSVKKFADANVFDLIEDSQIKRNFSTGSLSSLSSILEDNDIDVDIDNKNLLQQEQVTTQRNRDDEPRFSVFHRSGLGQGDFFDINDEDDDDNDNEDDEFADDEEYENDNESEMLWFSNNHKNKKYEKDDETREFEGEEDEDITLKLNVHKNVETDNKKETNEKCRSIDDVNSTTIDEEPPSSSSSQVAKPIGSILWSKMKKAFNYKPNFKFNSEDMDSEATDFSNGDEDTEKEDDNYTLCGSSSGVLSAFASNSMLEGLADSVTAATSSGSQVNAPVVINTSNSADEDELPAYDDLFPDASSFMSMMNFRGHDDHKSEQKTFSVESSTRLSEGEVASSSSGMAVVDDEADTTVREEAVFNKYFGSNKITVRSDIRLMFFWLPFLVLLICILLANQFEFFSDSFKVAKSSYNDFAASARGVLGNVMLGKARVERIFNNVNDAVMTAVAGAGGAAR